MTWTRKFQLALFIIAVVLASFCSKFTDASDAKKFEIPPHLNLSHYSIDQGLSLSVVTSFAKTQDGFVWVGTEDGLNRFDGYQFDVIKRDLSKNYNLYDNSILTLLADRQGRLWIGTEKGLAVRYRDGSFSLIRPTHQKKYGKVIAAIEDIYNRIWVVYDGQLSLVDDTDNTLRPYHQVLDIATTDLNEGVKSVHAIGPIVYFSQRNCLNNLDLANLTITKTCFSELLTPSGQMNEIVKISSNKKDTLWMATKNGAFRFNSLTQSLEKFSTDADENRRISDDLVQTLIVDNNDNVWIGTADGLSIYNPRTDSISNHYKSFLNRSGMQSNDIVALYQDNDANIWIGSYGAGFHIYSPFTQSFKHYFNKEQANYFSSSNIVHSVTTDLLGGVWIGSYGDGLFYISPDRKVIQKITPENKSLEGTFITSLHFDIYDNLWIASLSGLSILDPDINKLINLDHPLLNSGVISLAEDRNGDLWVSNRSGLLKLKRFLGKYDANSTLDISNYSERIRGLLSSDSFVVNAIYEDVGGLIWIGTEIGLVKLDPNSEEQWVYLNEENNEKSLSNNYVLSIYEDSQGTIWIGTSDGLNQYIKNNDQPDEDYFTRFTEKDGLINDSIYGIQSGKEDSLWLSTSYGLIEFKTSDYSINHFGVEYGLQSSEFNAWASHKSADGEIFFGGVNGVTAFFPEDTIYQDVPANLTITRVEVNNKAVSFDYLSPSVKILSAADFITISLSSMDFYSSDSIVYRYRMKSLDQDWVELRDGHTINIYGLEEGEHFLEIQAKRKEQAWVDKATLIELMVGSGTFSSKVWNIIYIVIITIVVLSLIFLISRRIISKGKLAKLEIEKNREYLKTIQIDLERERSTVDLIKQELSQYQERVAYYERRFEEYARKDKITSFYRRKFFEEVINSEEVFFRNNHFNIPDGCFVTVEISNYYDLVKSIHKANVDVALAELADLIRNYISGDDIICRWNENTFLMLESGKIDQIKSQVFNFYRLMVNRQYDCGNGRMVKFDFSVVVMSAPLSLHKTNLINRIILAETTVDFTRYFAKNSGTNACYASYRSDEHPTDIEKLLIRGPEYLIENQIFELVPLSELIIKETTV
ncbi:MAG: hypothetical protein HWE27_07905 [Gammaproteobacteria bacterium]|nr:hypothetical protein [Gammaproteobacteria bacterium]